MPTNLDEHIACTPRMKTPQWVACACINTLISPCLRCMSFDIPGLLRCQKRFSAKEKGSETCTRWFIYSRRNIRDGKGSFGLAAGLCDPCWIVLYGVFYSVLFSPVVNDSSDGVSTTSITRLFQRQSRELSVRRTFPATTVRNCLARKGLVGLGGA